VTGPGDARTSARAFHLFALPFFHRHLRYADCRVTNYGTNPSPPFAYVRWPACALGLLTAQGPQDGDQNYLAGLVLVRDC